jgi:hypothetical protein
MTIVPISFLVWGVSERMFLGRMDAAAMAL